MFERAQYRLFSLLRKYNLPQYLFRNGARDTELLQTYSAPKYRPRVSYKIKIFQVGIGSKDQFNPDELNALSWVRLSDGHLAACRIGHYRVNDHPYHVPQFSLSSFIDLVLTVILLNLSLLLFSKFI